MSVHLGVCSSAREQLRRGPGQCALHPASCLRRGTQLSKRQQYRCQIIYITDTQQMPLPRSEQLSHGRQASDVCVRPASTYQHGRAKVGKLGSRPVSSEQHVAGLHVPEPEQQQLADLSHSLHWTCASPGAASITRSEGHSLRVRLLTCWTRASCSEEEGFRGLPAATRSLNPPAHNAGGVYVGQAAGNIGGDTSAAGVPAVH